MVVLNPVQPVESRLLIMHCNNVHFFLIKTYFFRKMTKILNDSECPFAEIMELNTLLQIALSAHIVVNNVSSELRYVANMTGSKNVLIN